MKTVTQFQITIGTHNILESQGVACRDNYVQEWAKALTEHFGGCTITKGVGNYIMLNGELVQEQVIQFTAIETAMTGEREFVEALAMTMRTAWQEECVLVTESQVAYKFV